MTLDSSSVIEVRSNFQTHSNQGRHYSKYRERRRGKQKHFRALFGSDCEDEITSVVSDNPQLYHRSASMVSIQILKRKYPLMVMCGLGGIVNYGLEFNFSQTNQDCCIRDILDGHGYI